jgi:hypothetical protein
MGDIFRYFLKSAERALLPLLSEGQLLGPDCQMNFQSGDGRWVPIVRFFGHLDLGRFFSPIPEDEVRKRLICWRLSALRLTRVYSAVASTNSDKFDLESLISAFVPDLKRFSEMATFVNNVCQVYPKASFKFNAWTQAGAALEQLSINHTFDCQCYAALELGAHVKSLEVAVTSLRADLQNALKERPLPTNELYRLALQFEPRTGSEDVNSLLRVGAGSLARLLTLVSENANKGSISTSLCQEVEVPPAILEFAFEGQTQIVGAKCLEIAQTMWTLYAFAKLLDCPQPLVQRCYELAYASADELLQMMRTYPDLKQVLVEK